MTPLAHRLLTAAVLIPLVVAAVLWLPAPYLGLLLGAAVMVAADEWTRLAGLGSCGAYLGFILAQGAALLGMAVLLESGPGGVWWFAAVVAGWIGVALGLARVRAIRKVDGPDPLAAAAGFLALPPAWGGLMWLHGGPHGPLLMLFLLSLVWVADSGAFFAGRRWGRHKLAPALSPGKTWEGVYGALAGGAVWSLGLALGLGLDLRHALGLVALGLAVVALSIVGDLFESWLKRRRGFKDSGRILPGHGGMLDRIDSLTAAAPLFALGIHLLGVTS